MAKLLMLFVDGFEDTEGIATLDVLTRGGHEVTCASMMGRPTITPKLGRSITIDTLIENIKLEDFDGVVIPGGPGSFKIMCFHPQIDNIIKFFADHKKLVSAICAAPFMIGRLGLLYDKKYTVHPGFEDLILGGYYLREEGVVRDGNFITGKSMYYSIAFGLEIDEYFNGKEHRYNLEKSCQGEK